MNPQTNICFITVFNHKYEDNIEKLDKIYQEKFSNRYYLMPFYEGHNPFIFSVYESSYFFQGYFSQSLHRFYNEKYTHYIFIADDLILNPKINQDNICQLLNISSHSAYIKSVFTLHNIERYWDHILRGIDAFYNSGGEYQNVLPTYEQAIQRFQRHGIVFGDCMMSFQVKWMLSTYGMGIIKKIFQALLFLRNHQYKAETLPYPIVGGYSDFVIVPASSIKKFLHYCGVFAAINLFVEIALPTALLLACENVVFEQNDFQGIEFWEGEELELMKECHSNVKEIFEKYPSNLYFHPIKLSKWHV